MRLVIQRVSEASVTINSREKGRIERGLLIFLGIEERDGLEDIEWLSQKVVNLRIFNNSDGVMQLSIKDNQGAIMLISQFTLFASTRKGNRPSYIKAAKPSTAVPLYEAFISQLTIDLGKEIQTGTFGADMKVAFVNDGPITILIDSKTRE
jgi:D-tyrosyl-tRNA(Tyr) deacylase